MEALREPMAPLPVELLPPKDYRDYRDYRLSHPVGAVVLGIIGSTGKPSPDGIRQEIEFTIDVTVFGRCLRGKDGLWRAWHTALTALNFRQLPGLMPVNFRSARLIPMDDGIWAVVSRWSVVGDISMVPEETGVRPRLFVSWVPFVGTAYEDWYREAESIGESPL